MTANDDRARQLIEQYPRHLGNETAYLRDGFEGVDVSAVVAILLEMLRSGDRDRTWHAVDFINQVVIRHVSPEFTAALPRLGVYRTLRDLLYVPDKNVRHNAIYALGKTTHYPNARYLVGALPTYIERYPLELDGLFFELFWLSRTVAAAGSTTSRWSPR
jgi:hypothetical protein